MKQTQVDFSKGSVRSQILATALPMLVAQMMNLLYNIVDRIYIGQIPGEGTLALAGLGLCFPVITLITAFANLFGIGGAPLCAIERGRGDTEKARQIMGNAFMLLMITGAALTAAGILFLKPLLYAFGASDATYPYASQYLFIYVLGTLFVMTSLGMNPYINCQGFAKTGMQTVILGAVTNLVLDPVLIFGLGWGITGAAVATVFSQFLSAAWVFRFLTRGKVELTLPIRDLVPDWSCVRQITALGTASFVMSCTDSFVQIACNSMLSLFGGDLYIGVMTVLSAIRQIAQTPVMAITDGASPVISYHYGARSRERVLAASRFMAVLAFAYVVLIWAAVSLFPAFFIRLFNQDAALVEAAVPALRIYFAGFIFMAFQFVGQTVFKALNHPRFAVFFSILRKLIIVVPLTLWLPHLFGLGVNGVFWAEPISNVLGGLACFLTMYFTVIRSLKGLHKDEGPERT
jgi:putative MATE family efflux protein